MKTKVLNNKELGIKVDNTFGKTMAFSFGFFLFATFWLIFAFIAFKTRNSTYLTLTLFSQVLCFILGFLALMSATDFRYFCLIYRLNNLVVKR